MWNQKQFTYLDDLVEVIYRFCQSLHTSSNEEIQFIHHIWLQFSILHWALLFGACNIGANHFVLSLFGFVVFIWEWNGGGKNEKIVNDPSKNRINSNFYAVSAILNASKRDIYSYTTPWILSRVFRLASCRLKNAGTPHLRGILQAGVTPR